MRARISSIDARPSDSIALALKTKPKIYAAEELLTDELDRLIQSEGTRQGRPEPSDEQPARRAMAVGSSENLNPEGLREVQL